MDCVFKHHIVNTLQDTYFNNKKTGVKMTKRLTDYFYLWDKINNISRDSLLERL